MVSIHVIIFYMNKQCSMPGKSDKFKSLEKLSQDFFLML